jgi:hypothetical protein
MERLLARGTVVLLSELTTDGTNWPPSVSIRGYASHFLISHLPMALRFDNPLRALKSQAAMTWLSDSGNAMYGPLLAPLLIASDESAPPSARSTAVHSAGWASLDKNLIEPLLRPVYYGTHDYADLSLSTAAIRLIRRSPDANELAASLENVLVDGAGSEEFKVAADKLLAECPIDPFHEIEDFAQSYLL